MRGTYFDGGCTLVIYNYNIGEAVDFDATTTQKLQERTVLHELGHYLGFSDLDGSNDISVMKTKNTYEDKLLNNYFTIEQLRQIQAIRAPGWRRVTE